jgi:hypothetical protein
MLHFYGNVTPNKTQRTQPSMCGREPWVAMQTGNLHIVAMPCNQAQQEAQQDGMVTAGSSVPEAANVVNLP